MRGVQVNYPKTKPRINLEQLGEVREPERRSMYQVMLHNLKAANRVRRWTGPADLRGQSGPWFFRPRSYTASSTWASTDWPASTRPRSSLAPSSLSATKPTASSASAAFCSSTVAILSIWLRYIFFPRLFIFLLLRSIRYIIFKVLGGRFCTLLIKKSESDTVSGGRGQRQQAPETPAREQRPLGAHQATDPRLQHQPGGR